MSEGIEQFKRGIEGEGKDEFIKGVSEILEGQGLKVLNEDAIKGLFSDNTKTAIAKTHEALAKRGLPILKDGDAEMKYYKQSFAHIDALQEQIKTSEAKISDLNKLADTGDADKLRNELSEYKELLVKSNEEKLKAAEDHGKLMSDQKRIDAINHGLTDFKFLPNATAEEIDSGKAYAVDYVSKQKTEERDGVLIYIGPDGKALRGENTDPLTTKDMLASKLSFIIDKTKPTTGLGTKAPETKTADSTVYQYMGAKNQAQLVREMKKWGKTKGVKWHDLQPLYRQLVAEHDLLPE